MRFIKTRLSEKYETIPSSNVDQWIKQTTDNPLSLDFVVNSKTNVKENVRLNAEVVMNGLTSGKSYGIHLLLVPFSDANEIKTFVDGENGGKYDFSVNVNGFSLFKKSYTASEIQAISAETTPSGKIE